MVVAFPEDFLVVMVGQEVKDAAPYVKVCLVDLVVVVALLAHVPLLVQEEEEVILVAAWAMIVALLAVAAEARTI